MAAMTTGLVIPLVLGLGAPELLIIVGILVLLFGAKKLPELARGSGRALRIFKSETKGLLDDDDDDDQDPGAAPDRLPEPRRGEPPGADRTRRHGRARNARQPGHSLTPSSPPCP